MELKKKIFPSITFILVLSVIFGCRSNDYDEMYTTEMRKSSLDSEVANSRTQLISSIGKSDEFLDYIISMRAFSKKFDDYYSALNEEEKKDFSSIINNDDCIEQIINDMDIKNEIELITLTKRNLIEKTSFSDLVETERAMLFNSFSYLLDDNLIKTRSEGNDAGQCEKAKKQAYDLAGQKLLSDQNNCDSWFEVWTTAHAACLFSAKLSHSNALSTADEDYRKCIESNK